VFGAKRRNILYCLTAFIVSSCSIKAFSVRLCCGTLAAVPVKREDIPEPEQSAGIFCFCLAFVKVPKRNENKNDHNRLKCSQTETVGAFERKVHFHDGLMKKAGVKVLGPIPRAAHAFEN
jgi:hypothetical protein